MTARATASGGSGPLARAWLVGLALTGCLMAFPAAGRAESSPVGALNGPGSAAEGSREESRLFEQAVSLGVPRQDLAQAFEACSRAGFSAAELQRVLRLIARAKLAGLPHEDLLNKLREGLAKGASPEAIQGALERKAQVLRRAKGVVDTLMLEGWSVHRYEMAVQMVSDALEAGADPAQILRSVRQDQPCPEGVPDVRTAFQEPGKGQ